MAKLKEDIKRMLSALAYQDADEYLSPREKMNVLGYGKSKNASSPGSVRNTVKRALSPRIALIVDGQGTGASLTYAIDAAQRQGAQIDLLFHGAIDTKSIGIIERHITQAGLVHKRIQLSVNSVDDIIDYVFNQSTLIYLVSTPEDVAIRELVEVELPKLGKSLPVPLVLMNSGKLEKRKKRTAA